jgi:hypothetical protein
MAVHTGSEPVAEPCGQCLHLYTQRNAINNSEADKEICKLTVVGVEERMTSSSLAMTDQLRGRAQGYRADDQPTITRT